MKTETYTITHEDGHWLARHPGVLGVAGSRSLTSLLRQLREAASFTHGDTVDEPVELRFVYELPAEMAPALAVAREEERLENEHKARRLEALKEAAKQLTAAGLSEREAGLIMDLSGSRVHQLRHSA